MVTEICLVGRAVAVVCLRKHKDVITASEWVLKDGSRTEVDVRVMARSLVGRRAVEVPDTEVTEILHFLHNGLFKGCIRHIGEYQ